MSDHLEEYWRRLAYSRRDLSNCESEPLRFCGAIQGHGQLLAWDSVSQEILAASENCADFFELDVELILGQPIQKLLPEVAAAGQPLVSELELRGDVPRLVSCHSTGGVVYAEIEAAAAPHMLETSITDLRRMVYAMEAATDEPTVCEIACDHLRRILGYDRVMIYRFEPNWDGQVVAESREGTIEPYLGLLYPASDIPAQARDIYLHSRYRLIGDVDQLPARLVTRVGKGRSEVDLGQAILRASSPIHIEYLRNMGVRSSFCVPIRLDGKLWGLISCHHLKSPHIPWHHQRSAAEMAAQVISAQLNSLRNQRRLRTKNSVLEFSQQLLARVVHGKTAVEAFEEMAEGILELTNSQGAFVRMAGQEARLGNCPEPGFVEDVWALLRARGSTSVWGHESLSTLGLKADPAGAGVLAVPLSLGFEDLLIWFRPEHVREVNWGGAQDPRDKSDSLRPRSSFAAWTEQVSGRCREWSDQDHEAAQYLLFNFVQGIFENAADLARANVELERLTQAKDEFIGMISHELRTPLAVIVGWIDVLRDFEQELPELAEPLDVLERNAKIQVKLINDLLDVSRIISGKLRISPEADTDLLAITKDVVASLQPTAAAKDIELRCAGSAVLLTADPDRLRQIIWNLISNALKFTPKGGVVEASVESEGSDAWLRVKDTGIGLTNASIQDIFERFAQVSNSGQRSGGLGLGLSIVKSLVELHGGTISAESDGLGKGSCFRVALPIYPLRVETPQQMVTESVRTSKALEGWRVALAEDQADAASALAYLLRRQGAQVDVFGNGVEAFEALRGTQYTLLLSDIGMPSCDGYQLIQRWRALEQERRQAPLPAIALTAHASAADRARALEAGFNSHIAKPVDRNELLAVIRAVSR